MGVKKKIDRSLAELVWSYFFWFLWIGGLALFLSEAVYPEAIDIDSWDTPLSLLATVIMFVSVYLAGMGLIALLVRIPLSIIDFFSKPKVVPSKPLLGNGHPSPDALQTKPKEKPVKKIEPTDSIPSLSLTDIPFNLEPIVSLLTSGRKSTIATTESSSSIQIAPSENKSQTTSSSKENYEPANVISSNVQDNEYPSARHFFKELKEITRERESLEIELDSLIMQNEYSAITRKIHNYISKLNKKESELIELLEEVEPNANPASVNNENLEELELTTENPEIVQFLQNRKKRSSEFIKLVREAYECRCAISQNQVFDLQGRPEVEVAHIYPKALDGKDDPRNGICLSRFYHWAFDRGLFTISDDYLIQVHQQVLFASLTRYNGQKINLPKMKLFSPHPIYLQAHRRLHGFE